jgi:hypothetical protein
MASTTLDGATTVADWEMNEAAGATTMVDSSANHLDGTIIPSDELQTGVQFDVDTLGYHWVRRPPNLPPAVPERIVQVPDNNLLDVPDPSVTYTLEIRYRTKENFGNIVQKGQSASRGGQIKVQQPMGRPSCLFKGSLGRVTARVKAPLNDKPVPHADLRPDPHAGEGLRRREHGAGPDQERLDRRHQQPDPVHHRRQDQLRPDRHDLRLLLRGHRLRQGDHDAVG